jgi:hypothetical protein
MPQLEIVISDDGSQRVLATVCELESPGGFTVAQAKTVAHFARGLMTYSTPRTRRERWRFLVEQARAIIASPKQHTVSEFRWAEDVLTIEARAPHKPKLRP